MINKKDLARKLSKRSMLNQKEANLAVDELFHIMVEELKKGEEISITGLGKFYFYQQKPRPVRNPKTQEEMVLKEYQSVRFKPSELIKRFLKNKI